MTIRSSPVFSSSEAVLPSLAANSTVARNPEPGVGGVAVSRSSVTMDVSSTRDTGGSNTIAPTKFDLGEPAIAARRTSGMKADTSVTRRPSNVLNSGKEVATTSTTPLGSAMETVEEDSTMPAAGSEPKRPTMVDTATALSPAIKFRSPRGNTDVNRNALDDVEDDVLPHIPGTRRLGNRRLSRAQGDNSPLMAHMARKNSILAMNVSQMSPKMRLRMLPPLSPAASKLRFQQNVESNPYNEWNAEAFRIKRREAQLALELLPKYTAAMRAGESLNVLETRFESIMSESIEAHMDDEYELAAIEIVRDRTKARALFAWKVVAASLKKKRDAKIKRPPSFCAKIELLSSQGQRVPSRPFSRGGSFVNNNNNFSREKDKTFNNDNREKVSSDARPRVDSSVTATDVTDGYGRPSDDDSRGPSLSVSNKAAEETEVSMAYLGASRPEDRANLKARPKSKGVVKVVNALIRVASFRSPVKS